MVSNLRIKFVGLRKNNLNDCFFGIFEITQKGQQLFLDYRAKNSYQQLETGI